MKKKSQKKNENQKNVTYTELDILQKKISIFTYIIISLVIIGHFLYIGKQQLIPFVMSCVICFIFISIKDFYQSLFQKIPLKKISCVLSGNRICMLFSIATILYILYLLGLLIGNNIPELSELEKYQVKFFALVNKLQEYSIFQNYPIIPELLKSINIPKVISITTGSLKTITSKTGLIFICLIFLLLEYRDFGKKLNNEFGKSSLNEIIQNIYIDIKKYIGIKTLTSFSTALISYWIMIGFGLDFPMLWAIIIFILNFIPTVGSIFAILFTATLALVQFNFTSTFIFLIFLLSTVQVIIGNFIEPNLSAKTLNLSPTIIILSLLFWGSIWGVTGAFLCVPIMVTINIILSQSKFTQTMARMLSATGKIEKEK